MTTRNGLDGEALKQIRAMVEASEHAEHFVTAAARAEMGRVAREQYAQSEEGLAETHGHASVIARDVLVQFTDFQSRLSETEEVGLALHGSVLRVAEVGFLGNWLFVVRGQHDGREVELLQHVSQLNLLLVRVSVLEGEKPRRIGFLREEGGV